MLSGPAHGPGHFPTAEEVARLEKLERRREQFRKGSKQWRQNHPEQSHAHRDRTMYFRQWSASPRVQAGTEPPGPASATSPRSSPQFPGREGTHASDIAAAQAISQTLDQQPKTTVEKEVVEVMRPVMETLEETRHRTGAVSFGEGVHKVILLPGAVTDTSGRTLFVAATEEGFKGLVLPPSHPQGLYPGDTRRLVGQAARDRSLIPRVLEETRTSMDGIVVASNDPKNPPGYYSKLNSNTGADHIVIAGTWGYYYSFNVFGDTGIRLVDVNGSIAERAVDASLAMMMKRQQPSIDAAQMVGRKLQQ